MRVSWSSRLGVSGLNNRRRDAVGGDRDGRAPHALQGSMRQRGFTMVEIAICLAVIGFALVAIIGVLPLGISVQTDNRQDTIIAHDGAYFLDAIRKGAPSEDLPLYVEEVIVTYTNLVTNAEVQHQTNVFRDAHHIIGLLSNPNAVKVDAIVRALNGAAAEKGDYTNDLGFKYRMTATVRPFESLDPTMTFTNGVTSNTYWWQTSLTHEVRLVMRYPLTHDKKTGAGRKVFRALVSGKINTNRYEGLEFLFYRPTATNVTDVVNVYAP